MVEIAKTSSGSLTSRSVVGSQHDQLVRTCECRVALSPEEEQALGVCLVVHLSSILRFVDGQTDDVALLPHENLHLVSSLVGDERPALHADMLLSVVLHADVRFVAGETAVALLELLAVSAHSPSLLGRRFWRGAVIQTEGGLAGVGLGADLEAGDAPEVDGGLLVGLELLREVAGEFVLAFPLEEVDHGSLSGVSGL